MFNGFVGARTLVVIALVVLLVWAIIWPIRKLGQKPSGFWITVLTLTLIITTGMEIKWLFVQSEATKLVKQVSQNPEGYAVCQRYTGSFFDAQMGTLGFVSYSEGNKANIKYIQCQKWADFLTADKTNLNEEHLLAVGVIIHEAIHVGKEFNEATTQCLTIKKLPDILHQYGVTKTDALKYAETYRELSLNMPAKYLNGVC